MGILEGAQLIKDIAQRISREKGITEQEVWNEAVKEFKEKYECLV
ncbi:hypothetical protein CDIFMA2_15240 [Clostridioides difficile]|nr:hypothetical protein CDIFMA2_15240 [Clostridioides difficile]